MYAGTVQYCTQVQCCTIHVFLNPVQNLHLVKNWYPRAEIVKKWPPLGIACATSWAVRGAPAGPAGARAPHTDVYGYTGIIMRPGGRRRPSQQRRLPHSNLGTRSVPLCGHLMGAHSGQANLGTCHGSSQWWRKSMTTGARHRRVRGRQRARDLSPRVAFRLRNGQAKVPTVSDSNF